MEQPQHRIKSEPSGCTHHQALDIDRCFRAMTEGQWLTALRYAHAGLLASFPPLQHTWVDLSEQLEQTARRGGDRLVTAFPVLDQISE